MNPSHQILLKRTGRDTDLLVIHCQDGDLPRRCTTASDKLDEVWRTFPSKSNRTLSSPKATQFEIVADGAEVAVEQAKNRVKKELSTTRNRWQAFLEGRLSSWYTQREVVADYKKAMIEYQKVVGPLDEKEAELLAKFKSGKKVEVVVTRTVSF